MGSCFPLWLFIARFPINFFFIIRLNRSALSLTERSFSNFWANWRLLYVRDSFLRHYFKNSISDSFHLGFPPLPGNSQSPSLPRCNHLCKTSLTVCGVQLKWAAIFSTYGPCAFNLITSALSLTFCGTAALLSSQRVLSCFWVRNTLNLAPIYWVTSVDVFSLFTYFNIVRFFHADLLNW